MKKSTSPVALASSAGLEQDPHAIRHETALDLESAIGYEVRGLRKQLGLTITDIAATTGLSAGMLSKIENGAISPSLTTLQLLARALSVPLTTLFRRLEDTKSAVFVPAGEGLEINRRGARAGHQYSRLGHLDANSSGLTVEPYMITLTTKSDVFRAFQHAGLEFIYMLEGKVQYRHSDRQFMLEVGDSLFFDADAPHGPEQLIELPARYLAIISYPSV